MGQKNEAFWNQDMGFHPYETEFSGTDEVMQPLEGPVHFTPCFLEAPSQEYGQWELLLLTSRSNGGNPGTTPFRVLPLCVGDAPPGPGPAAKHILFIVGTTTAPWRTKQTTLGQSVLLF